MVKKGMNFRVIKTKAFVPDGEISIYDTVKKFGNREFDLISVTEHEVKKMALSQVVNLHNQAGIREPRQITAMSYAIKSGLDIYNENGIPNIKMALTCDEELLLFGDHHSILAYMATGKEFLEKIPHLLVYNENGYVENHEILPFFGEHYKKLNPSD